MQPINPCLTLLSGNSSKAFTMSFLQWFFKSPSDIITSCVGQKVPKNISTRCTSYGLIDLYQFLHTKFVLPARFLNFSKKWHINNKKFFTMSRSFALANFQLPYFFYWTCTKASSMPLPIFFIFFGCPSAEPVFFGWFLLFVNAFLAIVNFVCVLASYCQLAKILFPPLFFPFLCLIIWMVCSYIFF